MSLFRAYRISSNREEFNVLFQDFAVCPLHFDSSIYTGTSNREEVEPSIQEPGYPVAGSKRDQGSTWLIAEGST